MTATQKILLFLHKHGPSGCYDVGHAAFDNHTRRGRICSVNGGGDYAAQMLLGRMRKAGLVRTSHTEGSSRWDLTSAGREAAQKLQP